MGVGGLGVGVCGGGVGGEGGVVGGGVEGVMMMITRMERWGRVRVGVGGL